MTALPQLAEELGSSEKRTGHGAGREAHEGREFFLFCSQPYIQNPELCLDHEGAQYILLLY